MTEIKRIIVGPLSTNCYAVTYAARTVVIDPGAEAAKIIAQLTAWRLTPIAIVNTHGHWDHVMADNELKQHYNIPLYTPLLDRKMLELEKNYYHIGELLVDHWYTDTLPDLPLPFKVIATPGHTPGSSCLLLANDLFSGDTMFAGGYLGRTDLWGGDAAAMQLSLARLLQLPDDTVVWPGHDGSSTIGRERSAYVRR